MKISLAKKLSLAFLLTAFISIVIASLISNYMIDKKFDSYLINEHKLTENKVSTMINSLYDEKTGFSENGKDEISRYSSAEELYIEIKASNGSILFTSNNLKPQMHSMMGAMMHNSTASQYTEDTYSLEKHNKKAGTIILGYYSSSYFSSAAEGFITTLNHSFLLAIFIALIFSVIISIFFSRQISSPLINITETANKIRTGNLNAKCSVKSKTKELAYLSESINYLGATLKKQELIRKRLTSDMAHELRTPLTNLKSHIEALLDKIWQPTDEVFMSFYEEIERLIKLVKGLNDIAKLEEVNITLNKTTFDLSLELKKIAAFFEPVYKNSGLILKLDIPSRITAFLDRDKLKQVMYNLLSNARKYSKNNGEVLLKLYLAEKEIIIEVKDNGIGISEADLPFIFERLYRSDESRSRNTGGAGIGLTITKNIVEAHGGNIEAKSKLGEGSLFVIRLPK